MTDDTKKSEIDDWFDATLSEPHEPKTVSETPPAEYELNGEDPEGDDQPLDEPFDYEADEYEDESDDPEINSDDSIKTLEVIKPIPSRDDYIAYLETDISIADTELTRLKSVIDELQPKLRALDSECTRLRTLVDDPNRDPRENGGKLLDKLDEAIKERRPIRSLYAEYMSKHSRLAEKQAAAQADLDALLTDDNG